MLRLLERKSSFTVVYPQRAYNRTQSLINQPHSRFTIGVRYVIQSDKLYMAVCFLNFSERDLSSVRVYSSIRWTSHFYKVPEQHRYVYLVTFHKNIKCFVHFDCRGGQVHNELEGIYYITSRQRPQSQ